MNSGKVITALLILREDLSRVMIDKNRIIEIIENMENCPQKIQLLSQLKHEQITKEVFPKKKGDGKEGDHNKTESN